MMSVRYWSEPHSALSRRTTRRDNRRFGKTIDDLAFLAITATFILWLKVLPPAWAEMIWLTIPHRLAAMVALA